MKKQNLVLAAFAAEKESSFTPVQVQKMFFLIDENISEFLGGKHFDFAPYNYGPFDKSVYKVLEKLNLSGDVSISRVGNLKIYKSTSAGYEKGVDLLENLPQEARDYIKKTSEFVRSLSFTDLVSSIYKAYPEMKKNSVFQG